MLNEKRLKNYIKGVIKEEFDSYNHPEQSNDNAFAFDNRTNARKFSHDGVDAYFARKDQDNMHKSEKDRIRHADKRWQKAADSRPLHRKGSLNRELGKKSDDYDDDSEYFKQEEEDELNYDRELPLN